MSKKVEVVCVIDKSGSMASIANDAIGSFNNFLRDQQMDNDDTHLTMVLFDTDYRVIHDGRHVKDVPPLTPTTYAPSGGTALLDAVGRAIDTVGNRLSITTPANRPDKVIVVIITDGEENSSREYSLEKVREKIGHQTNKYGWAFHYLGSAESTWGDAQKLGVPVANTARVPGGAMGNSIAYATATASVKGYKGQP